MKKRGRPSISGDERVIQEAPTAGNRGKRRNSVTQEDTENADDGELAKPPRRGRSSDTETELVAATELAAEVESVNKRKVGRPSQRAKEENGKITKSVRPGRPSNGGAFRAATEVATENDTALQEKRGRSVQAREEFVETATKPVRRGRSSNTEAELVAARGEKPHKDAVPDKERGRSLTANTEEDELGIERDLSEDGSKKKSGRPALSRKRDEHIDEPVKHPNVPKKRGRPAAVRVEEPHNNELSTDGHSYAGNRPKQHPISTAEQQDPRPPENIEFAGLVKELRLGQSSNTQDELQAVAKPAAKSQAHAKKRGRPPKAIEETNAAIGDLLAEDNEAARPLRRGRPSSTEAEILVAVQSTTRRAQKSEAEKRNPANFGSVGKGVVSRTARGPRSGTVIEIEAATSSLARDRNVLNKVYNSSKVTTAKATKRSSTTQEPPEPKSRARPSPADIERRNGSQQLEKRPPKHPAHTNSKRKHKRIEGRLPFAYLSPLTPG